jgi:crotonobetainyl-CoA:carnitine CoA-transferase CaiB-like acyl-CoA transferase
MVNDEVARVEAADGPLAGVRVLEVSETPAGRVAGMLLACLGADVARVRPEAGAGADAPAVPSDVDSLTWDRGKRLVAATVAEAAPLARRCDIVIVDRPPSRLRADGLDAPVLRTGAPRLIHLWLPPYAERGEWSELAAHPLLLDGAGGVSAQYPASDARPVAPAFAATMQLHGALAAAAAAAALVDRKLRGAGREVVIGGLHAVAAQIAVVTPSGIDTFVKHRARSGFTLPHWRLYRTADGRWVHLATLTGKLFRRALDAMGRADIMDLPAVAQNFADFAAEQEAARVACRELEAEFASRPARYWLDLLNSFDVPCAEVAERSEWAAGEIVAQTRSLVSLVHPVLGQVRAAAAPFEVSDSAFWAGVLPSWCTTAELAASWDEPPADGGPARDGAGTGAGAAGLPLRGVRVVDASSFLAGPFVGALLADWGADVVKVEPPSGDPYRGSVVAALVASQRKRVLATDLAAPEGREAFLALLAGADVLVENFRPGRLDRLGLAEPVLEAASPGLVHCKVAAYASTGPYANAPGFDPVLQSRSGMAIAQGGPDSPVTGSVPMNDTGTGALGALACLAALYASHGAGRTRRVEVSLARTATFLQSRELTDFAGRPPVVPGRTDFAGPTACEHFYQCADGWLAVAATTRQEASALTSALGADGTEDMAAALRGRTVAEALSLLRDGGVPAVRIPPTDGLFDDPFLVANDFSHVVADRALGRVRVIRCYGDWRTETGRVRARSVLVGHDTRAIMAELGYAPDAVDGLLSRGVLAAPAGEDEVAAAHQAAARP